MTSLASVISENQITGFIKQTQLNQYTIIAIVLVLAILFSAFTVIWMKNSNRNLFVQMQVLQKKSANLQTEWGQLLLEQSAWATQARIEKLAREELNMEVPNTTVIKLIRS